MPFTGYVCYPAAALLGLIALITGITHFGKSRLGKRNGRTYALFGVWIGEHCASWPRCAPRRWGSCYIPR